MVGSVVGSWVGVSVGSGVAVSVGSAVAWVGRVDWVATGAEENRPLERWSAVAFGRATSGRPAWATFM